MAHFAEIDSNNIVVKVIVINNEDVGNLSFPESEKLGQEYIKNVIGLAGKWLQTSYNGNFRENFAGASWWYIPEKDIFVPPKPYDSWKLTNEGMWEAPKPIPTEPGKFYIWEEDKKIWKEAAQGCCGPQPEPELEINTSTGNPGNDK